MNVWFSCVNSKILKNFIISLKVKYKLHWDTAVFQNYHIWIRKDELSMLNDENKFLSFKKIYFKSAWEIFTYVYLKIVWYEGIYILYNMVQWAIQPKYSLIAKLQN